MCKVVLSRHPIFFPTTASPNSSYTPLPTPKPRYQHHSHRIPALSMASLNHLKNNNHTHIRTLISVGGWNFNKYTMSQLMLNNYNRKRFVDSSLRFALLYGFDGVDLDFEYPSGRQKQQFTKLVKVS